jgi:hypothetical protein
MRAAQLYSEIPTLSGSLGPSQSRVPLSSETHYHRAPFGARRAAQIALLALSLEGREVERAAPISPELGRETTLLESAFTSLFVPDPRPNSFAMRTYITAGGRGVTPKERVTY